MPQKSAIRTRQRWLDPRLAIGLGLVIASVAGVVGIVSWTDRTTLVYSATSALSVGDVVHSSDLEPASVRLGSLTGRYLQPGNLPADGLVVTRDVGVGELVPMRSVSTHGDSRTTRIVLTVTGPLPEAVEPGAAVDVWGAVAGERGQFAPPTVIVDGARVVRLVESTGIMASGQRLSLELQVPKDATASVLEAQVRGDSIAVVPAAGSRGQ